MTKNFAKPFIVAAALLFAAVSGPVNAQASDKSGYLTDTRGAVSARTALPQGTVWLLPASDDPATSVPAC